MSRGRKLGAGDRLGRWSDLLYIMGQSIVGVVEEDAFHRGWWAYGCERDWQDVRLGIHPTASKARREVQSWVKSVRCT